MNTLAHLLIFVFAVAGLSACGATPAERQPEPTSTQSAATAAPTIAATAAATATAAAPTAAPTNTAAVPTAIPATPAAPTLSALATAAPASTPMPEDSSGAPPVAEPQPNDEIILEIPEGARPAAELARAALAKKLGITTEEVRVVIALPYYKPGGASDSPGQREGWQIRLTALSRSYLYRVSGDQARQMQP